MAREFEKGALDTKERLFLEVLERILAQLEELNKKIDRIPRPSPS